MGKDYHLGLDARSTLPLYRCPLSLIPVHREMWNQLHCMLLTQWCSTWAHGAKKVRSEPSETVSPVNDPSFKLCLPDVSVTASNAVRPESISESLNLYGKGSIVNSYLAPHTVIKPSTSFISSAKSVTTMFKAPMSSLNVSPLPLYSWLMMRTNFRDILRMIPV